MSFSELSGVTIVIFIAVGALILVLLFLFAKRQIMRFALRSRRGTLPVGHDAPRWLRKEIERRLDLVGRVKYEPRLVQEDGSISPVISNPETKNRMQAMDDVKVLEIQLNHADSKVMRMPGDNLRTFLMGLITGILKGCNSKNIHTLCDLYERARYSPDSFTSDHLEEYRSQLANLIQVAQANKNNQVNVSPKLSSKGKRKKVPEQQHQVTVL